MLYTHFNCTQIRAITIDGLQRLIGVELGDLLQAAFEGHRPQCG